MRSLDELRDTLFYDYNELDGGYVPFDVDDLADEIEAEIDRYYLPRPLFEDGEPAKFGDRFVDGAGTEQTLGIISYSPYAMVVSGGTALRHRDDRLKRPLEPDNQEKIDDDAMLMPTAYCNEYGLWRDGMSGFEVTEVMIKHLLARQRNLDGKK